MLAIPQILLADTTASPAAWAVMLFCIILGLLVSLAPSKRTSEIKRPKDD
jgi:hypothetical protein